MLKIKRIFLLNKKTIAATASIVILVLAAGVFLSIRSSSHNTETTAAGNTEGQQKLNLDGPTKQEQAAGDEAKTSVLEAEKARNATSTQPSGQKASVTPVITYADHINPRAGGQIEVGAYVSNIFEDGGTCTLTLRKGSLVQVTTVTAAKGANSVDCPVMSIAASALEPGIWQAVVSYTSPTSQGQSVERKIEVMQQTD